MKENNKHMYRREDGFSIQRIPVLYREKVVT